MYKSTQFTSVGIFSILILLIEVFIFPIVTYWVEILTLTFILKICKLTLEMRINYFCLHEFHETCHSITFFHEKTPNNAVTPQRQSQFTPKMKAKAVPRLLSSLV